MFTRIEQNAIRELIAERHANRERIKELERQVMELEAWRENAAKAVRQPERVKPLVEGCNIPCGDRLCKRNGCRLAQRRAVTVPHV